MRSLAGIRLSVILIISIVLIACGCSSPRSANQDMSALPSDKYVALYEEYDIEGTVLEGNGTIAFVPVPCPVPRPFDYNGTRGFLEQYPQVNNDLKIMYGWYLVFSGPATGYSTARYRGIYILPYTLDSRLMVRGIDFNGTISASYDNQTVFLKIGDIWQSPVTTEVKNETHQIIANNLMFNSGVYRQFLIRYNSSWTVENKGIFPKSNISGN